MQYVDCPAVRTIIFNTKNEIILLYASKDSYYKIPGGGIEADEDLRLAGEREAMERTGCRVEMDTECMAISGEWRNDLYQI